MKAQQAEARRNSTLPTRGTRAAGTELLNLPLMNKGIGPGTIVAPVNQLEVVML